MEQDCKKEITRLTGHDHVLLTARANKSILLAMKIAQAAFPGKTSIIIPDQGGWLTYKQSPGKIKMAINEVKTDYGVIDLEDLKRLVGLGDSAAFIYTNPAGYFAHQPIKEIYEVCKGRCLVILDASGCLGDRELGDGRFADIMVGSFGKWKPVNAGKGGFISFLDEGTLALSRGFYENDHGLSEKDLSDILTALKAAPARMEGLMSEALRIKEDLKDYEILHREKRGLNVVVRLRNAKDKEEILSYCAGRGLEATECPRYIRVNEYALSIEVKRT